MTHLESPLPAATNPLIPDVDDATEEPRKQEERARLMAVLGIVKKASAQDPDALICLTKAGVITENLTDKKLRKRIGTLWAILDNLLDGQPIQEPQGFDLFVALNSLFIAARQS